MLSRASSPTHAHRVRGETRNRCGGKWRGIQRRATRYCGRIMHAWYCGRRTAFLRIMRGKSPACSWCLTSAVAADYGVGHRQSAFWFIAPTTGIAQIAAVASDTVAITLRCTVGVKQSGDMMPRGALALPRCLGTDAVNPRRRMSTVRALNRARLRMGADTAPSSAPRREYGRRENAEDNGADCGRRGRIRWVCRGIMRHAARVSGHVADVASANWLRERNAVTLYTCRVHG